MSELLAAIVGAIAAYVFDIRRGAAERRQREADQAQERRARRATLATLLILDLRNLEVVLRQFYHAKNPAGWVGKKQVLYFDSLRAEVRLFSAGSVAKIDEFYRITQNLFDTLDEASSSIRAKIEFGHFLKVTAAFALQAMPAAREALIAEGGKVPDPRVLEVVAPPEVPKIPAIVFPDQAAPGSELPAELQ